MRRCLHAFLIAILSLALSMDAARACWFLRTRKQCRPIATTCPPPAWSGCSETVVVREWVAADGCCPPVACETIATCCGEGGSDVVSVGSAVAVEQVGEEAQSVVVDQPTPAAAADSVATGGIEPVAPPLPELRSLRVGDAVVPASNDQPVSDPPAAVPAVNEGPAEADPAPADEPEMREDAVLPVEPLPGDPTDVPIPAEETPPAVPPIPGLDDDEPPMEEDADPADEPAPAPEPTPEPTPEPAEPAEPNLFEEFEDEDAPAGEEEMTDEEEASNPFADDEPEVAAADEEMADEPSDPLADEPLPADADPFDDAPSEDPETLDEPGPLEEDEVMVDDSEELPAADAGEDEPAPADPFADDEPAPPTDDDEPLPAADDEPEPEPAAGEDPFASAEPKRRWIHASGAHSLVATLVDVAGDGSCVLETDGRQIRVPLDNLSGHDRDYVRDAGVRLAAVKGMQERAAEAASTAAPAATDTAGR